MQSSQKSLSLIKKIIFYSSIFVVGAGIAYYLTSYQEFFQKSGIKSYNAQRDTHDMMKLFNDNWYLLTSRERTSKTAAQLEQNFIEHSPDEYEPRYFGKMTLKVARDPATNALIGFITYYARSFYEGRILYLVVNKDFRGKKYAEKLMDVAAQAFKKQGIKVMSLYVRVENEAANKVYKRYGFKQVSEEDGFLFIEKIL